MTRKWAVQSEGNHHRIEDAVLDAWGQTEQEGCFAVRFQYRPDYKLGEYGKSVEIPVWRVLAYYETDREFDGTNAMVSNDWLPDGMRYVLIPDSWKPAQPVAQ